jgi:hypothetical protein
MADSFLSPALFVKILFEKLFLSDDRPGDRHDFTLSFCLLASEGEVFS